MNTLHEGDAIKTHAMSDGSAEQFPSVVVGPWFKAEARRKMREKGVTQPWLAEKYQMDQGGLSKLLKAEGVTSSAWAIPLSRELDIPLAYEWFVIGERILEIDPEQFRGLTDLLKRTLEAIEEMQQIGKDWRTLFSIGIRPPDKK